jgi:hypothetical protein
VRQREQLESRPCRRADPSKQTVVALRIDHHDRIPSGDRLKRQQLQKPRLPRPGAAQDQDVLTEKRVGKQQRLLGAPRRPTRLNGLLDRVERPLEAATQIEARLRPSERQGAELRSRRRRSEGTAGSSTR